MAELTNVTASGDISASGNIIANELTLSDEINLANNKAIRFGGVQPLIYGEPNNNKLHIDGHDMVWLKSDNVIRLSNNSGATITDLPSGVDIRGSVTASGEIKTDTNLRVGSAMYLQGSFVANDGATTAPFQVKGSDDLYMLTGNIGVNNIGIGVQGAATEKLHVVGNIKSSGDVMGNTGSFQTTTGPSMLACYVSDNSSSPGFMNLTTTYATIQASGEGAATVFFIVPGSEKTIVEFQVYADGDTDSGGEILSLRPVYKVMGGPFGAVTCGIHQEIVVNKNAYSNADLMNVRWFIDWDLLSQNKGTAIELSIQAKENSSNIYMRWGGSTSGTYPPLLLTVTAVPLPATFGLQGAWHQGGGDGSW